MGKGRLGLNFAKREKTARSSREGEKRARARLEGIFRSMDFEERQRRTKPNKTKGKRAEF